MAIENITPKIGSRVWIDNYLTFEILVDEDCWDKADFRIPTGLKVIESLAVNVEVTGRSIQYRSDCCEPVVRVKITFVGDGEPDQISRGWMIV